jgi:hypothetical protein
VLTYRNLFGVFIWTPNGWNAAPKQIGCIDGFYDYAIENTVAEHPDITFKRLENDFPGVRDQIVKDGFRSWIDQKKFLLSYMQMIRARSPLFFDQWREQSKAILVATITEVGADGRSLKVDSLEGRPPTEAEIQNWTISKMREEIKKGPDWLENFHWAATLHGFTRRSRNHGTATARVPWEQYRANNGIEGPGNTDLFSYMLASLSFR